MRLCSLAVILLSLYATVCKASSNTTYRDIYLNKTRGYGQLAVCATDTADGKLTLRAPGPDNIRRMLPSDPYSDDAGGFIFRFRAADHHIPYDSRHSFTDTDGQQHNTTPPGWSIILSCGQTDVSFTIRPVSDNNIISPAPALGLCIRIGSSTIENKILTEGLDTRSACNSFLLDFDGKTAVLNGGNRKYAPLTSVTLPAAPDSIGFEVTPGGNTSFSDISLTPRQTSIPETRSEWMADGAIENRLKNPVNRLEGIWTLFDSTLDDSLMRHGGDYRLALVEHTDGSLLLLYLEGARTASTLWKKGMTKVRLIPTGVDGVYDAEWTDASGRRLNYGIKAQRESPSTLRIMFPYQNSQIRLQRLTQTH